MALFAKIKYIIKESGLARAYKKRKYGKTLATPEKIENAINRWGGALSREERAKVAADIKATAKKFGFDAEEYFFFDLGNKTDVEKRAFVPNVEALNVRSKMNKGKNRIFFDNKWEAYRKFQKYYCRDACLVESERDFPAFEELARKHGSLILKPLSQGCGNGVQRIDTTSDTDMKKLAEKLLRDYRFADKTGFIAEQLIVQVDEIAEFHRQSVNTVRISTFKLPDRVEIVHPFIRLGVGDHVADNGAQGGLLCTIDKDTGRIYACIDEACKRYTHHPDSGKQIIGFVIPRWEEAKTLAVELAQVVPDNLYTGWDLALTERGWVMVEGNESGWFVGWQLCDQKGFRSELEGYLKEMGIRCK